MKFPEHLKIVARGVGHNSIVTDAETGKIVDAPIKRIVLDIDANSSLEVTMQVHLLAISVEHVKAMWVISEEELRFLAEANGFDIVRRP